MSRWQLILPLPCQILSRVHRSDVLKLPAFSKLLADILTLSLYLRAPVALYCSVSSEIRSRLRGYVEELLHLELRSPSVFRLYLH